jgi:hypothetical protein
MDPKPSRQVSVAHFVKQRCSSQLNNKKNDSIFYFEFWFRSPGAPKNSGLVMPHFEP